MLVNLTFQTTFTPALAIFAEAVSTIDMYREGYNPPYMKVGEDFVETMTWSGNRFEFKFSNDVIEATYDGRRLGLAPNGSGPGYFILQHLLQKALLVGEEIIGSTEPWRKWDDYLHVPEDVVPLPVRGRQYV